MDNPFIYCIFAESSYFLELFFKHKITNFCHKTTTNAALSIIVQNMTYYEDILLCNSM